MHTNGNLSTPAGPLVFLGTFTGGYELYTLVNLALDPGAIALLAAGLLLLMSTPILVYTVIEGQLPGSKLARSVTAIFVSMYIGAALFISFIAR